MYVLARAVNVTDRFSPSFRKSSLKRFKALARSNASSTDASVARVQDPLPYFSKDKRPIVLFDGVCNMCNGGVNFILDWDKKEKLRFGALQGDVGKELLRRCGRRPDDISSIVLVEENGYHLKSDAVLKIAQVCEMPLPILSTFLFWFPAFFRDGVYDVIADNRYSFLGMRDTCRITDETYGDRFVT